MERAKRKEDKNAPVSLAGKCVIGQFAAPMSKHITLKADGSLLKVASKWLGASYRTLVMDDFKDWARILNAERMTSHFTLGITKPEILEAECVLKWQEREGAIARSQDHLFAAPQGTIGIFLMDVDQDTTWAKLDSEMSADVPEWKGWRKVVSQSTSAGISRTDGRPIVGAKNGLHVYLEIDNHDDLRKFGEWLEQRLWLAGHGYIFITKAGAMLPRVRHVDHAALQYQQPIFEAPPTLGEGLTQKRDEAFYIPGTGIDFGNLTPITDAEKAQIHDLIQTAKQQAAEQAKSVRKEWATSREQAIASGNVFGISEGVFGHLPSVRTDRAKAAVRLALEQDADGNTRVLTGCFPIHFDEFGFVTAADVLMDASKFGGATCADPMEPEYGGGVCKAKVFFNADSGTCIINSFAHGMQRYSLMHDDESLEFMIRGSIGNALKSDGDRLSLNANWMKMFDYSSAVSATALDRCIDLLVNAKVGLKSSIKKDLKLRARERQNASTRANSWGDDDLSSRHIRTTVFIGVKSEATIIEMEKAILATTGRYEMMQRDNHYVRLGKQRDPLLFIPDILDAEGCPVAAPEQMSIMRYDETTALFHIESTCDVMRQTSEGPTPVSVPEALLRHFLKNPNKNAPEITSILSVPFVMKDGTIVRKSGLDPVTGLYLNFKDGMFQGVPDNPTPSQCAAAVELVNDIALAGYVFDGENDRRAAFAILMTSVTRQSYQLAPAFLANAHEPGCGKTTLMSTSVFIASGIDMAVSQAGNDEEMQKGLLSQLARGAPSVIFDNLREGSSFSFPSLAALLTSIRLEGRLLGLNEIGTYHTRIFIGLTGNKIVLRNDWHRRLLVVNLRRRDSANEKFGHSVDYTNKVKANREALVCALLTLVVASMKALARGEKHICKGSSDFGDWDLWVREPMARAGLGDLRDNFLVNKAADVEGQLRQDVLLPLFGILGDKDGTGRFTTNDVVALVACSIGQVHKDTMARMSKLWPIVEAENSDGNWTGRSAKLDDLIIELRTGITAMLDHMAATMQRSTWRPGGEMTADRIGKLLATLVGIEGDYGIQKNPDTSIRDFGFRGSKCGGV